jgi:hypothetical protein
LNLALSTGFQRWAGGSISLAALARAVRDSA